MNSTYISSSIFNDKSNYVYTVDFTKLKNTRVDKSLRNFYSKDFSSNLKNIIINRDHMKKINVLNLNYNEEK